jgi:RNA ligase
MSESILEIPEKLQKVKKEKDQEDFSVDTYTILAQLYNKWVEPIHPALTMTFDELHAGLEEQVNLGYVNKQTDGDLHLYDYNMHCTFEKAWNIFTLCARGLILDVKEKKIICLPYPKFFNYGETLFMPDLPISFSEKMDGSCTFIWYYKGEWRTSTRGSFNSDQAVWAKNYLSQYNLAALDRNVTHIAECIYKENKIVISYDFEGLVLTGGFDRVNGSDFDYNRINSLANSLGYFKLPKVYNFKTVQDALTASEKLSFNEEGFVARFKNGYRIKIKGSEYCRIHRLISNVRPLFIWDCLANNDDMSSIKKELPEELLKDFEEIEKILTGEFYLIVNDALKLHEETKSLSDKELGLMKAKSKSKLFGLVFFCRKGDFQKEVSEKTKIRKSIFNLIRPDGNVLKGYTPSNAVNRFSKEAE